MTTISIYIDIKKDCCYCSGGIRVNVSEFNEYKFKTANTGFKCFKHYIWTKSTSFKLKFLIPDPASGCYKCLKLSQNGGGGQDTIDFKNGYRNVYVYFYGEDPRPLLVCYGTDAYIPKDRGDYESKWVKVKNGISKCVCEGTVECVGCDKLLEELVRVVGFLNHVELQRHPNIKGNGCTNSGSPSEGNTCATSTNSANTCTYPVHQYGGKQVQIRVTCEPVTTTSPGTSCYKKLIHEPVGFNGAKADGAAEGFRLGYVVYNIGSPKPRGIIPYYTGNGPVSNKNRSNYWFKPLVSVSAYFYNGDTKYLDPLLVVLEFANGTGNDKECYKLTASVPGSMTWEKEKDQDICKKLGDSKETELVNYLDSIRYELKKVLKVEIDKKGPYQAMARDASALNGVFQALNGASKNITVEVEVCEIGTCETLKSSKYKCYKHEIKKALSTIPNQVAGVAFTIPGIPSSSVIDIKLFNGTAAGSEKCEPGENGKTGQIQLFYNKCMDDVYVFFYGTGSDGNEVDTVPLMLWYDKNYYRPCDRENYFKKWVQVPKLSGEPCKNGDVTELVDKLNEVNRALNQIDLEKSSKAKSGTSTDGYGLPETGMDGSSGSVVKVDTKSFKIERVKLTKQDGPKQGPKPLQPAYYRVVHRTVNGFQIGEIKYGGQEIVKNGVKINGAQGASEGDVTIGVKKGSNHKKLVDTHKWNTVVAYYSKSDEDRKLPQLLVILKTDKEVTGQTVQGSAIDKDYGYYILSSKTGSGAANVVSKDYEYVWHEVTNGKNVTLDDATDFSLLNSVVILLDEQCKKNGGAGNYDEKKIKEAISKAGLKSPGQSEGQINRITGKDISVEDSTSQSTCLNKTGFKLITHDISQLVTLDGSLKEKLRDVTLIAGLRFLIPTRDSSEKYQQLILSESSGGNIYLYFQTSKTVSVYFYGNDPRPLLACYNGNAYKPIGKRIYFYWWDKDKTISNCDFKKPCENLIKVLADVSNFLNRVDISNVPSNNLSNICFYQAHKFKGQEIKIKVESKKADGSFCYHRYTHTHCGTCQGDGEGFRLGTIDYGYRCIKENNSKSASNGDKCITSALNGESGKYTAASKVVVFYYQGDKKFERPLLVALCENSSKECKLYYELQKDASSSGVKNYTRGSDSINLSDFSKLGEKLDGIRYNIAITLQIIIDKIPMETLYCFKCEKNGQTVDCNNDTKGIKCYKASEVRNKLQCETIINENGNNNKPKLQCKIKENLKKDKKNNPDCVLLSAGKSLCYQTQLYNTTADTPVKNGSAPPKATTKDVKVTPVKCKQLTKHGYRCYEHQITSLPGVEQIGGLKFYLWDNTSGGSGSPSNGRELCLYKDTSSSSLTGTQGSCPAAVSTQPAAQTSCSTDSNLELVNTTYTTCKGNVYVYFYGDDPRPLMLCYGGNAYGPRCMAEYECRWVCVVNGCVTSSLVQVY